MKPQWRKIQNKLSRGLSIASDISSLLLMLGAKPRPLDYVALGIKGADIAFDLVDEFGDEDDYEDPQRWFNNQGDTWQTVTAVYEDEVIRRLTHIKEVTGYCQKYGNRIATQLCSAELTDSDISVMLTMAGSNEGQQQAPEPLQLWVRDHDYERLRKYVGERFWNSMGANHIRLIDEKNMQIVTSPGDDSQLVVTDSMMAFRDRVEQFRSDGPRSYMLEGVPGTGKTTAAMWAAQDLGLRTLQMSYEHAYLNSEYGLAANSAVSAFVPECVIIDDLDRMADVDHAIPTLELWHALVPVLIVTINHRSRMSDALLRPGRLDDHISYNNTDPSTIKELLGDQDAELVGTLAKWPVAYVRDFVKRRNVLGSAAARAELHDLDARVQYILAMGAELDKYQLNTANDDDDDDDPSEDPIELMEAALELGLPTQSDRVKKRRLP